MNVKKQFKEILIPTPIHAVSPGMLALWNGNRLVLILSVVQNKSGGLHDGGCRDGLFDVTVLSGTKHFDYQVLPSFTINVVSLKNN